MDKTGDANITISRPMGGGAVDKAAIKITVRDEKSGAFVEVEMTPHDFAIALTGLAHSPAQCTAVRDLDKWGREQERCSMSASCMGAPDDTVKRRAWEAQQVRENWPEGAGWEFKHGSYDNRLNYNMHFVRWGEWEE